MESINWEIIVGLLLGIGLSASCGFRVFIPLLIAAVAGKMHWIPMADSFAWLTSWTAIVCFGVAATVEALAYYIPVVDNVLDTIATPVAVLAGTLVSASYHGPFRPNMAMDIRVNDWRRNCRCDASRHILTSIGIH